MLLWNTVTWKSSWPFQPYMHPRPWRYDHTKYTCTLWLPPLLLHVVLCSRTQLCSCVMCVHTASTGVTIAANYLCHGALEPVRYRQTYIVGRGYRALLCMHLWYLKHCPRELALILARRVTPKLLHTYVNFRFCIYGYHARNSVSDMSWSHDVITTVG